MSGTPAEQDNSIEEILASIRQIISEDEPKPAEAAAPVPEPAPAAPVADADDASVDDVFELVDRVVAEEEPEETPEEIVVDMKEPEEITPPAPAPMPQPAPAPVYAPEPVYSAPEPVMNAPETPIFTDVAAAATLGAFSKLSETILIERQRAIAGAQITLEDIVKELLSPLLRTWIDQHVPGIVERLVREELEKLARQAREG